MPTQPVPINKGLYSSLDDHELTNPAFAAQFKNLLLSQAGANVDRPDLELFVNTAGLFGVVGLAYWNSMIVAVTSDRSIYSVDPVTMAVTDITGTALEGTSRPSFANDGDYLVIAGGGLPRVWSGAGNTSAMPGAPPDTRQISYFEGYWVARETDTDIVYFAGPTAALRAVWDTANDFLSAEVLPDTIKAQIVFNRELYEFGQYSVQVFQHYGETAVPFRTGAFIDAGCIAEHSVVQANNTLYWLDHQRQFREGIRNPPAVISSGFDKVIKDPLFTVNDCWGAHIVLDGHFLVLWVFPTEEKAYSYDYLNKEWSEWSDWVDGSEDLIKINCHLFVEGTSTHFVGHPTLGKLYKLTKTAKGTAANTMRRVRTTGYYDHGTGDPKRSNYYLFHVKRGVGTPGNAEPQMLLRYNDDGKGWSNEKAIKLGNAGSTQRPLRVTACRGTYRKRKLEIVFAEPYEFILAKVEENVDLLRG